MLPKFYQVHEGLIINLNYLVFAEERRTYYESANSKLCSEMVENDKTFRIEVSASPDSSSQRFDISSEQGRKLIQAVVDCSKELAPHEISADSRFSDLSGLGATLHG